MIEDVLSHHILDHALFSIYSFTITKHMSMILLISVLMCVFLPMIIRNKKSSLLKTAIEGIYTFVQNDIAISTIGDDGKKYTPYLATLFLFIFILNISGMVPFSTTATGNISVTAGLSISTFILIVFTGIRANGIWGYIKSFIPTGTPKWLIPFMFPLEIISFMTKIFALAIRLFANMIAGHIVLICFIFLIFIISELNLFIGVGTILPTMVMTIFVSLLEILVIFIQAYVFTMLTAIFVSASLHPH